MMKSKKNIFIIILTIIFLISILFITIYLKKKIGFKEIDNNIYYAKYDSTWKLKERKDDRIVFKNNDSSIIIQISNFDDEHKYVNINDLFDEIIYNIKEQNPSYKLLTSKKDKITKNSFDGYKLLYENNEKQVMIWMYNDDDKFIVINYESPNKYFDILLDSVNNIVYNFTLKEEKYDLSSEIDIKFAKAEFSNNDAIDSMLTDTKSYEIADHNYLVNYSIPSSFSLNTINSYSQNFTMQKDYSSPRVYLGVSIYESNIFDEIKYKYNSMKYYRENEKKEYINYKEIIDKLDSKYTSYIYKINYTYTKAMEWNGEKFEYRERQDEETYLFYALNNSHTLVIDIRSTGSTITKKMIDMIKIKNTQNYSSYIKIEKEGDYLIGELKKFADYKKDKVRVVTLKIPDRFKEIDKGYGITNVYETRHYGYNYDEKVLIYDYEVEYKFDSLSGEKYVDIYNDVYVKSTYGSMKKVVYNGKIELNNKKFKIYSGGYTDIGGIMFTNINRKKYYKNVTILSYEIPDNGYINIRIDGNGKKISKELLKELTNFTIEEKNY